MSPNSKYSPIALDLLSILNNVNDLVSIANSRSTAKEVMRALEVYAKNANFHVPKEKIDLFYDTVVDSRSYTVNSLIKEISRDILKEDKKRRKSVE